MRRNRGIAGWRSSLRIPLLPVVLALVISVALVPQSTAQAAAPVCTISAKLVNSCRPWFGAESNNYGVSPFKARMLEHETRAGRQLDIVHAYMAAGARALSADQVTLATRPGTIGLYNWRVSLDWALGGGDNTNVNSQIDDMASSIKSLGSTKIMLTIYHEPEAGVSPGGSPNCLGLNNLNGTAGTTADYVNMWHNVRERFDALGVTNVVWVMNYMGYVSRHCLTKDLWPGNDFVDWIMWDPYPLTLTWNQSIDSFYNYLTVNSDAEHDFLSKPWGLAEFGYLGTNQTAAYALYDDALRAIQTNRYPKLKAYVVWDNWISTSHDDRVGYAQATHLPDPVEQAHYNLLANDPAVNGAAVPEPTDQVPPTVVRTSPEDGAAVSGTVSVTGTATDDVGVESVELLVDGDPVATDNPGPGGAVAIDWNTATVSNGEHVLRLWAHDTSGNSALSEEARVTVANVDNEAPTPPAGLSASWSPATEVTLGWSAASDNLAVTGYRIYRDGDEVTTLGPTAFEYVDTDAPNLATHSYTVTALDAAGNESDPSNAAEVETGDDTPPSASDVHAELTAPHEATLTWSASEDNDAVAGYRVYRNGTLVDDVDGSTLTLVDDGLEDAATYTYRVTAYDAAGNLSDEGEQADVTMPDATAPSTPLELKAVSSTQSVALDWKPSTDNVGVANYLVYRDGAAQPIVTLGATVTGWTDSAPVGSTLHRYRVTAKDAAGNESVKSNEVVRTIDSTAPSIPPNLRAVSAPRSVALTWDASTDGVGVTNYVVYRDSLPVVTLGGTTTGWTDTAPVGTTLHRYRVTAKDAAGNESAKSNEVARTIDATAPSIPLNLRAVSAAQSVALTWNASTDNVGVSNYVVYRDGLSVATLSGTTTTWTDSAPVGTTLHRYRVTARDATGNESAKSNEVARTLPDTTAPGAPTKLAGSLSGLTVKLTWTAATDNVGVTGYTIYRAGVAIGTSTTPTYTDTAPPLGKASSYTVRARDLAGNTGAASNAVSVTVPTDKTAPTTPGSLRATVGAAGSRQITLTWNASTDNVGVTSYYLYRANAKYKLLGKVTTTIDTGLKAGTKYTYKVYAIDAAGNWSGASATVSGTAR